MRVWRELGVGTDFQAMPIDDNAVIALARRRGGQRYLEITVSGPQVASRNDPGRADGDPVHGPALRTGSDRHNQTHTSAGWR